MAIDNLRTYCPNCDRFTFRLGGKACPWCHQVLVRFADYIRRRPK